MGNLTKFQDQTTATVEAIYAWNKKRGSSEKMRKYLGASIAGHECDRYLWFSFRQCFIPNFSGRIYRLFDRGNREESVFIEELRGIGCEVVDRDEDGDQIGISAIGGHFRGHLDGVGVGIPESPKTWHVLEFKTHCEKSFNELEKVGVKVSKPVHYAQMMIYMGHLKLTRALYLAVNKNDDRLHSERIHFNRDEFRSIMMRMDRIINSISLPDRCSKRSDYFRCKMCDAQALCWGLDTVRYVPLPFKSCRHCCHATPEVDSDDGRWTCNAMIPDNGYKDRAILADTDHPCSKHLLIPGFFVNAEPIDAGDTWIKFRMSDGEEFVHGDGSDCSSTTDDVISKAIHDE